MSKAVESGRVAPKPAPPRVKAMNRLRLAVLVAPVLALTFSARTGAQEAAPQTFSLDEALQYAIEHYPTVKAALEQLNASTANVDVAKSAYLPRFDALW